MSPNQEEVKRAGKRKMNEIGESSMPAQAPTVQRSLPFHTQQPYPSTALGLNINSQFSPNALNDSTLLSPSRNFQSFTALSTPDESTDSLSTAIRENFIQIDQAITVHGEQLKRSLAQMQENHYMSLLKAAEEKSSKKLKEKQIEINHMGYKIIDLEEKAEHARREITHWKTAAYELEKRWSTMQTSWNNIMTRRHARSDGAGSSTPVRQEEDQESSHVDPDRVDPVKLTCRVCGNKGAPMMLWQCHHLCVCKTCDVVTTNCPICQRPKGVSIEVIL